MEGVERPIDDKADPEYWAQNWRDKDYKPSRALLLGLENILAQYQQNLEQYLKDPGSYPYLESQIHGLEIFIEEIKKKLEEAG